MKRPITIYKSIRVRAKTHELVRRLAFKRRMKISVLVEELINAAQKV